MAGHHPHPWWRHVPPAERPGRSLQLALLQLRAGLSRRRSRILLVLLVYGGLCALPLLVGQGALTLLAVLPLVLVPPVGYLTYWLAWHEFHR